MISALFYPKELKDIIADLKAKDDLNEDALSFIEREFKLKFIFNICLALLTAALVMIIAGAGIFGFLIFIIYMGLIIFDAVATIKKYSRIAITISFGNLISANLIDIQKYNPSFVHKGWWVRYKIFIDGKEFDKLDLIPKNIEIDKFLDGLSSEIQVFYNSDINFSFPKIPEYSEKFYLLKADTTHFNGLGDS